MRSRISRRDFLKVTGVAGISSVGLLTGCAPKVSSDGTTTDESAVVAEKLKIIETKECDVIVAGTGSAGMAAAVRASELGARVIAIEKLNYIGGTSTATEGMCGVESSMQKELGITVTCDEVFTEAMSYHHSAANARVLRRWVDESANAVEWMISQGVKFSTVTSLGVSNKTWHLYDGLGVAMLSTLSERAKANGTEFLLNTSATELLMEDGKVTGLVAKVADGQGIQINAPVVILCTGGFSSNSEMVKKYCGEDISQLHDYGVEGRDGAGINMGLSANAGLHHPSAIMLCGFIIPEVPNFTSSIAQAACFQAGLWVNQNGVRYINEDVVSDFTSVANSAALENTTYAILDTAHMDALVGSNSDAAGNSESLKALYGLTGLTDLYDQVQELLDAGSPNVVKADTLEELATKMGVDPATLSKTVATYNDYCAAGKDDDFCKPAQFLIAEAKAPFYAFKRIRAFFTTIGGLKVNEMIQVVNSENIAIPGLYACGSDAGGIYGADYDVKVAAGTQQGWAIGSGKLAAEDAVQNYLKL